MNTDRLRQQMTFLKEIDKVKGIFRKSRLLDDSRYENDAEHAWHLAIMAMILAEYSNDKQFNLEKVIKMVLIHDLVEIDAGDTFLYDSSQREKMRSVESRAAERIFGLLPTDQCEELRAIWDEFERRETPESKFAASLDRFEPCLQNANTQGHAWQKHGVSRQKVEATNKHIEEGSRSIWEYTKQLFSEADERGYFPKDENPNQNSEIPAQTPTETAD